jgi:hypothetical protein
MNFSIECIDEVTQNDSSLRNEILKLFIDNLPDYIDELEFSFKQNDLEGLKKSAHKLKTPLLTLKVEGIINLLEFVEIPEIGISSCVVASRHWYIYISVLVPDEA